MSKQYDNTNQGAAFQKDGREDFSGTVTITATGEYWVNIYDNLTKDGKPWRKFMLKPKQAKNEETAAPF